MTSITRSASATGDQRSMTRHTPGPWRTNVARLSDNSINVAHVVSDNGSAVAQLSSHGDEETVANASLIAAAPDLLSALIMARECIAYCRRAHKDAQSGEGIPVEFFIDCTIAKATGAA